MTELQYHNVERNQHKFYRVSVEGRTVTVSWGRIGFEGWSQTYRTKNKTDAEALAEQKVNSKMASGYYTQV